MELRRNSHHIFRIMYHFVWIPKYRHKVFIEPYRENLKLIIKKIGYDYNIEIVELEIPTDHIHMVVKSEPKISPSDNYANNKKHISEKFLQTLSSNKT